MSERSYLYACVVRVSLPLIAGLGRIHYRLWGEYLTHRFLLTGKTGENVALVLVRDKVYCFQKLIHPEISLD